MTRTLVVAHDAGGAEVVSAWVRRRIGGDEHEFEFLLEGPAVAIFERKLGPLARPGREDALARARAGQFDFVLTGSGWATDLERLAVRAARAAGVRSATYVDHWVRYPERFELGGERVLPDEVWAGDEHALALARRELPGADVRLVPNAYFDDVVAAIRAHEDDAPGERILYVTEPTARAAQALTGDPLGYGYDELQALSGYLERVGPGTRMRLRPHPAEEPGKYDELLARHAVEVEVSRDRSLEEDVAWATHVVGCDSMAMAIGVVAGRRVMCAIPPGGRPLSLPFPEIERLYES